MTRNHEMNFYNYGKSLMAGSIVYTSQRDENDTIKDDDDGKQAIDGDNVEAK